MKKVVGVIMLAILWYAVTSVYISIYGIIGLLGCVAFFLPILIFSVLTCYLPERLLSFLFM